MRTSSNSQLRFLPCLLSVLIALVVAGTTQAQGVGSSRGLANSSSGIHTIQGRVYGPDGRPTDKRLRLRLESPHSAVLYSSTDQDGAFIFSHIQNGNYTLTVEGGPDYEKAVEHTYIDPASSPGGRIVQLNIHMRAKLSLNPIFANVPANALDLYKKALEASQKGDHKKAAEHLNKAVAAYQQFGPAYTELGTVYLKLNDPAKAAEALSTAVKLTPDDFQTRLNYGIALLNLKKFPEAEEQLSVGVQKNSASATAHMYLGIALMSQKKLDEAEKELQLSVGAGSNEVPLAHKYLGGIYWGKREYKRAAEELETYLKLAPKAPDAEKIRQSVTELRNKQ